MSNDKDSQDKYDELLDNLSEQAAAPSFEGTVEHGKTTLTDGEYEVELLDGSNSQEPSITDTFEPQEFSDLNPPKFEIFRQDPEGLYAEPLFDQAALAVDEGEDYRRSVYEMYENPDAFLDGDWSLPEEMRLKPIVAFTNGPPIFKAAYLRHSLDTTFRQILAPLLPPEFRQMTLIELSAAAKSGELPADIYRTYHAASSEMHSEFAASIAANVTDVVRLTILSGLARAERYLLWVDSGSTDLDAKAEKEKTRVKENRQLIEKTKNQLVDRILLNAGIKKRPEK